MTGGGGRRGIRMIGGEKSMKERGIGFLGYKEEGWVYREVGERERDWVLVFSFYFFNR